MCSSLVLFKRPRWSYRHRECSFRSGEGRLPSGSFLIVAVRTTLHQSTISVKWALSTLAARSACCIQCPDVRHASTSLPTVRPRAFYLQPMTRHNPAIKHRRAVDSASGFMQGGAGHLSRVPFGTIQDRDRTFRCRRLTFCRTSKRRWLRLNCGAGRTSRVHHGRRMRRDDRLSNELNEPSMAHELLTPDSCAH